LKVGDVDCLLVGRSFNALQCDAARKPYVGRHQYLRRGGGALVNDFLRVGVAVQASVLVRRDELGEDVAPLVHVAVDEQVGRRVKDVQFAADVVGGHRLRSSFRAGDDSAARISLYGTGEKAQFEERFRWGS
jgi:hypothetical protein